MLHVQASDCTDPGGSTGAPCNSASLGVILRMWLQAMPGMMGMSLGYEANNPHLALQMQQMGIHPAHMGLTLSPSGKLKHADLPLKIDIPQVAITMSCGLSAAAMTSCCWMVGMGQHGFQSAGSCKLPNHFPAFQYLLYCRCLDCHQRLQQKVLKFCHEMQSCVY